MEDDEETKDPKIFSTSVEAAKSPDIGCTNKQKTLNEFWHLFEANKANELFPPEFMFAIELNWLSRLKKAVEE